MLYISAAKTCVRAAWGIFCDWKSK